MKILILAAGYGTRLAKDLARTQSYKELRGVPKSLLPIAGAPLISHWLHAIRTCSLTSDCDVYLVVNDSNQAQFASWASGLEKVWLVSDGSTCNEERQGAVGCINLAVQHFQMAEHLMVIGGDTLFYEDFDLGAVVEQFLSSPAVSENGAMVTCYQCENEDTVRHGILETDSQGKVTAFLEKPSPDHTASRNACPCFYVLSAGSLPMVQEFLSEFGDVPLEEKDAPGNFIRYMYSRRSIYTTTVSGRFDVGNLKSYISCNEKYKSKLPIVCETQL